MIKIPDCQDIRSLQLEQVSTDLLNQSLWLADWSVDSPGEQKHQSLSHLNTTTLATQLGHSAYSDQTAQTGSESVLGAVTLLVLSMQSLIKYFLKAL